MFYWFLKWIAIGPLLRIIFRPVVEGAENVPAEGPAILASNHLSYADWLFMPLTLPRRVTFVAKAEYFTSPGIKGWFQKKFFSGAGQVPIDRSGANAAEGALSSARKILTDGDLFGIYPEGTRSHDGRLYRGKTGVARLALETKVPVIPVAVLGTDVVAPPGKKFGTFTRPGVRFGKPLDFSRYEGMENDRYILRSITDEIMYEIMRLSGQEYVDKYAGKAKEESKKAPSEQDSPRRRGRAEEGVLTPVRFWSRPALAVEDRLFRALGILRVVLVVNAVALNVYRADNFDYPVAGMLVVAGMVAWTAFTVWAYADPARRTAGLLSADLAWRWSAILVSPADQGPGHERHDPRILGERRADGLGHPCGSGRAAWSRGCCCARPTWPCATRSPRATTATSSCSSSAAWSSGSCRSPSG